MAETFQDERHWSGQSLALVGRPSACCLEPPPLRVGVEEVQRLEGSVGALSGACGTLGCSACSAGLWFRFSSSGGLPRLLSWVGICSLGSTL